MLLFFYLFLLFLVFFLFLFLGLDDGTLGECSELLMYGFQLKGNRKTDGSERNNKKGYMIKLSHLVKNTQMWGIDPVLKAQDNTSRGWMSAQLVFEHIFFLFLVFLP